MKKYVVKVSVRSLLPKFTTKTDFHKLVVHLYFYVSSLNLQISVSLRTPMTEQFHFIPLAVHLYQWDKLVRLQFSMF